MVFSTLKKFSANVAGKIPDYDAKYNLKTYGLKVAHVKHHFCLAPLHLCTTMGSILAGLYICRMLYVRDCIMFGWKKQKPISQTENITLFDAEIDFKKRAMDIPKFED